MNLKRINQFNETSIERIEKNSFIQLTQAVNLFNYYRKKSFN
jgi:hypothetical protein